MSEEDKLAEIFAEAGLKLRCVRQRLELTVAHIDAPKGKLRALAARNKAELGKWVELWRERGRRADDNG